VVVVLWSHASIASQNVRHEAMIARDAQKLVPVMIESLKPEDFPMGLYLVQGIQLLDWRDGGSKNLDKLASDVAVRLGQPAPARPAPKKAGGNPIVLFGVVAALALAGGGAYMWSQGQPHGGAAPAQAPATPVAAISPGEAPAACPGGGVPILGVCPAPGATLAPDPKADGMPKPGFTQRMVGHWRFNDSQRCREGPYVTLENGQLIFTTPGLRFVHAIEADDPLSTRTRVLEPKAQAGHVYQLTPEFFATSDERSFNLIVEDKTAGTRDVWTPCEVKS
jgi:hypothetical protein